MSARRFAVLMGLSLALGCLVTGHGLLLPALSGAGNGGGALVDANLARALAAPIAELASTVAALATCVVLALGPRAFDAGPISTLALTALAACGLDRLVLLPRMHEALGRVDLVSAAPPAQMAKLEGWELGHQLCVASACALLAAIAWIVAHHSASMRVKRSESQGPQSAIGDIRAEHASPVDQALGAAA